MTLSHESAHGPKFALVIMTMNHLPQHSMEIDTASMSDDKKIGVTHAIRERLSFQDERLWKRFLARRLELIDTLDLSSKKASEQEDEIKKVADMLRLEFRYGMEYFPDFDKLVRAAVQSVRRNRKRSTKTKRNPVKKRRLLEDAPSSMATPAESSGSERGQFLSEISKLNTDAHDDVYDMSYPRQTQLASDPSRAAIDHIIQPMSRDKLGVFLPPLPTVEASQQAENEKELQAIRVSLLLLIKSLQLCLESSTRAKNNFVRVLGQSSITAVSAMVFEKSFTALSMTSIAHLQDKVALAAFLGRFYRSLEDNCTLDDETASATLQTLIGCCVKDFGFDKVLYPLGDAFYRCILQEFPLVMKLLVPFRKSELDHIKHEYATPLASLANVVSELYPSKKIVVLRFLSQSLEFTYPSKNLAPPRFVELMDNARLAFKLNESQIFGLRDTRSNQLVNSDFDLEKIFKGESNIELEIFPQRFQAIPIYELTSAVTKNKYSDDLPKIILPPPIKQTPPPVLPNPMMVKSYRQPLLPKFQPLL